MIQDIGARRFHNEYEHISPKQGDTVFCFRNREILTDERYKTGYSWVSNLVTRGHLSETIRGFDEHNKATYEYHIIDNPTYTIRRGKTKRNNQVKVSKPERIMTSVTEVNDQRTYKLEITEGDMSIKVELPTAQDVITVITNVLIGRKK